MDCDKRLKVEYHHDLIGDENSKAKELHNKDYDDDTNFSDDGGEVPNDSDYYEPQPHNNKC
jgi:hypothetical protein